VGSVAENCFPGSVSARTDLHIIFSYIRKHFASFFGGEKIILRRFDDVVDWLTTCKSSATRIPKSLLSGTGQTWSNLA